MIIYCIFQKTKRKDFECFHYKEMVNIWGDRLFWLEDYTMYMCIKTPHSTH
jgi:hypothetical protein